jgi:hypothetical protein
VVEEVVSLFTAGAISTRTAVMMLHAAGLPIDDAALEVKRIDEAIAAKIPPKNTGTATGTDNTTGTANPNPLPPKPAQ